MTVGAAIPSTELEPSSLDGVQRWRCGHALGMHTRESAAECWRASQRKVPLREGASAPSLQGAPTPFGEAGGADRHAPSEASKRREGEAFLHPAGDDVLVGPLTAEAICASAAALVGGPRANTHGSKQANFQHIAELWNGYWRIKCHVNDEPPVTPFSAHDVGCMMELFKIARRFSGTFNADDYIDTAGYAGCSGEIAAALAAQGKRVK